MTHRSKSFLRASVTALFVMFFWSSAMAQTNTNAASGTQTNTIATNAVAQTTITNSNLPAVFFMRETPTPQWIQDLATDFPFLRHQYLGNELWKYLFSLVYIFLAFYISKFLDYATRVWLKRFAQRTQTQFDDLLLELLNGPIRVISFVIFLRIGLEVFAWPPTVGIFLGKGFTIIVAISLTYMVLKFVDLLMGYWKQRVKDDGDRAFDEQLYPIIRKSLKMFIVVVAVLVTLDNVGVNITAAIASLSIGGLAVGLAAQDTLANLFGAIAIFVDKPFRIGDRIQLEQVDGTVESIGLRSTRVRNADGFLVTIPNKTMGNEIITNVTRRPNTKTTLNFGLTYDTSVVKLKRASAILDEVFKKHPNTVDVWIGFDKFTDSTLNIAVVHWSNAPSPKDYMLLMQEINLSVKDRFEKEGIEFAFPTQTVYLKQDGNERPDPIPGKSREQK